jgi:glycosyltransferase involved in cell wall biosynthesis
VNILWLSWRDIRNPEAGGAEVFTNEVLQRLAGMGHNVTLFAAEFPGSSGSERIDRVEVRRSGSKYGVYGRAKEFCVTNEKSFDVIIDEMNVRPFLTPQFVRGRPVVGLIHQVPRKALLYELPFPVNYIVYHYLVRKWLSNYRDVPTMTVSASQQQLLREFGIRRTYVVPEGLSVAPLASLPLKESTPTVVFMGRLKKYKLADHAVKAFSLVKERIPEAKMYVIGDGYMRKKLERIAHIDVTFLGRVSDQAKYHAVRKAHLLLVPSVEEGWGLVVTEANAMGTPAVAYNVAGLRDSVKDGFTGVVTKENTPQSMASAAINLLQDKEKLQSLSANALRYAKTFSWDKSAHAIEEIIRTVAAEKKSSDDSRVVSA